MLNIQLTALTQDREQCNSGGIWEEICPVAGQHRLNKKNETTSKKFNQTQICLRKCFQRLSLNLVSIRLSILLYTYL